MCTVKSHNRIGHNIQRLYPEYIQEYGWNLWTMSVIIGFYCIHWPKEQYFLSPFFLLIQVWHEHLFSSTWQHCFPQHNWHVPVFAAGALLRFIPFAWQVRSPHGSPAGFLFSSSNLIKLWHVERFWSIFYSVQHSLSIYWTKGTFCCCIFVDLHNFCSM